MGFLRSKFWSFRIGLMLGVLGGLAFALVKLLGSRDEGLPVATPSPEPWPRLSTPPAPPVATEPPPVVTAPVEEIVEVAPAPEPVPEPAPAPAPAPAPVVEQDPLPVKKAAKKAAKKAPAKAWVEPKDGVCPTSHPVKAKLSSKIFHLPGMLNYERTNPDRCYADGDKAEADGLRAAKR